MKANPIAPVLGINPSATPTRWCPACRRACAARTTGFRADGEAQGWACSHCGAAVLTDRSQTLQHLDELLRKGEAAAELRARIVRLQAKLRGLTEATALRVKRDDALPEDIRVDLAARSAWMQACSIVRQGDASLGGCLSPQEQERVRIEREIQREFTWSCTGGARVNRGSGDLDPADVRRRVLAKERRLAEQRAARAVVDQFEEVA